MNGSTTFKKSSNDSDSTAKYGSPPCPGCATADLGGIWCAADCTTASIQPEPLPSRADKSAGEIAVELETVATRSAYLGYSTTHEKPPNRNPRATAVFVGAKSWGYSSRVLPKLC